MGWPLTRKPTDSRTFVNNIYVRSGKLPNWEPSFQIQLGDYGQIDRQTGLFLKEGSVFTDGKTRNAGLLKMTDGAEDDVSSIYSLGIIDVGSKIGANVEIAGITEAALKARFKLSRSSGTLLIMRKPVTSKLEGIEQLLGTEDYTHLKDKLLITEVVNCSAYAMYLSSKGFETIGLAYKPDVPSAAIVDTSIGAGVDGEWVHDGLSGVFRCGSERDQKYTTLFIPRIISKRIVTKRELYIPPMEEQMRDRWLLAHIPWNPLEENGEEREDEEPPELDENGCDW